MLDNISLIWIHHIMISHHHDIDTILLPFAFCGQGFFFWPSCRPFLVCQDAASYSSLLVKWEAESSEWLGAYVRQQQQGSIDKILPLITLSVTDDWSFSWLGWLDRLGWPLAFARASRAFRVWISSCVWQTVSDSDSVCLCPPRGAPTTCNGCGCVCVIVCDCGVCDGVIVWLCACVIVCVWMCMYIFVYVYVHAAREYVCGDVCEPVYNASNVYLCAWMRVSVFSCECVLVVHVCENGVCVPCIIICGCMSACEYVWVCVYERVNMFMLCMSNKQEL